MNGPNDPAHAFGLRFTNMETGKVMMGDRLHSPAEWGPPITTTKPVSGFIRLKADMIKLNDLIYNQTKIHRVMNPTAIHIYNRGKVGAKVGTNFVITINSSIEHMPASCNITTPSVPVRLPSVVAAKLNPVGATAGDTGFNIGLSCKTGTNVFVTLTDLTDQGNRGNQLTLTPDSTAQGVKLRILNNGQPVGYGPDSAEIGNLNQWHVGPSASTTHIPLSAQYIATGPVSAGTVKGVATFTMSYQ